ncbi:MAG TPA: M43 family zinc metalloprotease, partial [Cyclobacteriaceae bacterium]
MAIQALNINTPYFLALKRISCILLLGLSLSFGLKAQERCATVEYQKMLHPDQSTEETRFENWMKQQKVAPRLRSSSTQGTSAATYVIPVVVHVIHNGEPIGTGTNISDAQIISQINVLNKDYKRLNTDANQTPSAFLPVAGSLDIEFVLAKQDSEGLATDGIRRVQGTRTSWTLAQNAEFKALSYWPAEDYMNIWVINFNDNFIGYAQFPESSLPGLENSSSDRLTDGIVLNYRDIGSIDDGPFDLETEYNKGRTATHEIGHFFGLRHLWGDGTTCGPPGDYVDDTPEQSSSTNGCPSHPQVSCSNNKMFQNYLDYTNDACMNLFTQGQIARMEIVLQNSPRRASLTSSLGSQEPLPASNDLGLRKIINPAITSCGGLVTPLIEVRNYGLNPVTSAKIEFKVNGIVTETKDAVLNLLANEITTVQFAPINLSSPGTSMISFEILQTNGTTDGKASNNPISHTTTVPVITTLPLYEMFDSTPADWIIQNPDQLITWQNVSVLNGEAGNRSMFLNFDVYEEKGVEDRLLTPIINLNGATTALLRFDRAYAQFSSSNFDDALKVIVVENCNADLNQGIEIFNKSGSDLATAPPTSNSYFPNGPSQWIKESISLSSFIGSGNIQVAFIGTNGYGNNLFLDNVYVYSGDLTDVSMAAIVSPSPVVNKNEISPIIKMKNVGSLLITQIKVETKVNGTVVSAKQISSLSVDTGQELNITVDPLVLNDGSNTLQFTLLEPNGVADEAPSNNSLSKTVVVNNSTESIPARQNFNVSFQENWTILSQQSML